jgi:hypothetical protein
MPGWDEASVDELLADPIVRDLMAADGVDPTELRTMLYGVQRAIECYATRQGGPTSLAGFVKLCGSKPKANAASQILGQILANPIFEKVEWRKQTIRDYRRRRPCSTTPGNAPPGAE